MVGVDSFVATNFSESDSKFDSCIKAIVYGYSLLEKEQKYSRKEIKDIASSVRGRIVKAVELEDFLRNDLVVNFIEPYRNLFDLKYYQFQSGVEEFTNNIKTGVLDIKVCSPLLNGDTYFIFECKRLNKKNTENYITEGVSRFVKGQYYPQTNIPVAGMISFLESIDSNNKIILASAFDVINSLLKKNNKEINLIGSLNYYQLNCNHIKEIDKFEYIFRSKHQRLIHNSNINIIHIILDYNHLIN